MKLFNSIILPEKNKQQKQARFQDVKSEKKKLNETKIFKNAYHSKKTLCNISTY